MNNPAPRSAEHPPFPSPVQTGTGRPTPAAAAYALTGQLAQLGITRVYTAATDQHAVISVAAGLTVWTNGRILWWHHLAQPGCWPAADPAPAAAQLAALVSPGAP
jgi:hypothetical protein